MSDSSEILVKTNNKVSTFLMFLIAAVIGGAVFMGVCVNLPLQQLRSYHLPEIYHHEIVRRDELEYLFTAYMKKFEKVYKKSEFQHRLQIFKKSVSEIQNLNEAHNGYAKFGFTKFTDMSEEDFGRKVPTYVGENYNKTCKPKSGIRFSHLNESKPPTKFDWRERGYVTKVLDQGRCQSCWAHCVVGIMESMVMIKNLPRSRQYSNLSIQELIDCSDYTNGCNPGSPVNGLQYLCNNHQLVVTASAYPLTNTKGECKDKHPKEGVLVSRFMVETDAKPERIAEIVAGYGPVTTLVNSMTWRYYLKGVIKFHCSDSIDSLDHVVQVVGYNTEAEVPYFILRNSWGLDWGDQGYLYTAMTGVCGVGRQITYVDVDII